MHPTRLWATAVLAACAAACAAPTDDEVEPGMMDDGDGADRVIDLGPYADEASAAAAEESEGTLSIVPSTPRATLAGKRFVVFYQVSADILPTYADAESGLPIGPDHAYVFSQSHATAYASSAFAATIHGARSDFFYAPAFDVGEFDDWRTADDAAIIAYTHGFRDALIAADADFWAFNEAYSDTPWNAAARVQIMKILRHLTDPDPAGVSLRGIIYLTEPAATVSNWTSPADGFWTRVNETTDAVVAEHYHNTGFICTNSLSFLSAHYFALREWLNASGNAAKVSIANTKFTVLHSARFFPGYSGWAGGNSDTTTLARWQRAMSRAALATRTTAGGFNRISWAPMASSITSTGVHPRIRLLERWHYGAAWGGVPAELDCVADYPGNCSCD
jgi:hypothetical protein